MISDIKTLHDEFLDMKMRAHELLRQVKATCKELSEAEQCDIGYFLRGLENAADDFRKDCKAHKELLSKLLALELTKRSLTDQAEDTVYGNYSRGVSNLKMEAELPKRGTHEYEQLCKHFDIDPKLPFSPHWKRMGELVTECAEDGVKPPPGLGKTYPKFTMAYYKRTKR